MKRLGLVLLTLFLALTAVSCGQTADPDTLYIDVLDVGKADCTVIRHAGRVVMIDTAENENLPVIMAFLESKGIERIDTLILSHFDKDHIGGAEGILKAMDVGTVIESNFTPENFTSDQSDYYVYHGVLREQEKEPLRLTEPYAFSMGECAFQVLPPAADHYEKKEDNNASLIVTATYRDRNFAFFGDAMEDRLNEFIAENKQTFDFVKLPYHGNELKNYPEFLENVQCQYAVATCSRKNPASEETVSLLEEEGVTYYLTQYGSVRLTCDGQNLKITQ